MVEGGSMHFGVGQFCHWTATDPLWAAVFLFELRHFPKLISGKAPSMWHCNSVHVCVCMCAHMCVCGGGGTEAWRLRVKTASSQNYLWKLPLEAPYWRLIQLFFPSVSEHTAVSCTLTACMWGHVIEYTHVWTHGSSSGSLAAGAMWELTVTWESRSYLPFHLKLTQTYTSTDWSDKQIWSHYQKK